MNYGHGIDLGDKVVIVTGAGSGLGEAIARAFAAEGSCVACFDVNAAAADRVASDLAREGADSISFCCDVSDPGGIAAGVREVTDRFGGVDIVVNNAAVDHTVSVEDMTVEQWDQVIGVNLRGPFLMAKTVMPSMKERGGGHVFNVASTAAQRAWANASAYHASKWGLVGFSRGLSVEGRPANIRVTTVFPGGMKTHFFDRFTEQGIPMPDEANLQDPANVAQAIVFAAKMPAASVVQEMMVTPLTETSWP